MRVVHRINCRVKDDDGHIFVDATNRGAEEREHLLGRILLLRAMTDNKAVRDQGSTG
jgi:hypothetical protein